MQLPDLPTTAEIERLLDAAAVRRVGIVGLPPLAVIAALNQRRIEILDLDAMLIKADMESTVTILPRVYCAILRTVVLNAMHLELEAIIIDTGPGKCDSALHVATILAAQLPIPVLKTVNRDRQPFGFPLCRCEMDLTEKFLALTEGVKSARRTGAQPIIT